MASMNDLKQEKAKKGAYSLPENDEVQNEHEEPREAAFPSLHLDDPVAAGAVVEKGEKTTVMLRNIPNKYSQKLLLECLDGKGFAKLYDFFYLPIDFRNKCNLGYAFINFVAPEHAQRFKAAFQGYQLPAFKSTKVCEVAWARVQSLETNVEHCRNSPVNELPNSEYKPLLFSDGVKVEFLKRSTQPLCPHDAPSGLLGEKAMSSLHSSLPTNESLSVKPFSDIKASSVLEASTLPTSASMNLSSPEVSSPPSPLPPLASDSSSSNPVSIKRNKLFVGGLSITTTSETLRNHFLQFGDVIESAVITDKKTGQSRRFGFCTFTTEIPQKVLTSEHWIDGRSVGVRVYAMGGLVPASSTSTNPSAILQQQQQQQQQLQALSAAIQAQQAVALNGGLAPGVSLSHSLLRPNGSAEYLQRVLQLQMQQQLLSSQLMAPQNSSQPAMIPNIFSTPPNPLQFHRPVPPFNGMIQALDSSDSLSSLPLPPLISSSPSPNPTDHLRSSPALSDFLAQASQGMNILPFLSASQP